MDGLVGNAVPALGASDHILHDVIVIGAGFGGLCMGIRAKQAGLDVLVLERADDVGGTWRDNTYPGCACDTQSHHYSLSFARNADWSRRYASQPEILDYMRKTAKDFGLLDYIRFGVTVTELTYDDARSVWQVKAASGIILSARFVVSSVGQLNQPSIPDLPGLDQFNGRQMHSAEWDDSYDFRGKTVAMVGSGASAIQMIPPLAEQAKHLYVFQRSPNWLVAKYDRTFKSWEKTLFRYVPFWAWIYRATIYWAWERFWPEFLEGSRQAIKRTSIIKDDVRSLVPDEALAKDLTPTYPLGCKRILLSDNFYPAMQRDNVTLVTDGLSGADEAALSTKDGGRYPIDCIAWATGFKSHDFLPGITVRGRNGQDIHETWAQSGGPEAYMGITMPGFPNLFFTYGPNTNLGHNSVVFMLECQVHYIMKAIRAVASKGARSIEVSQQAKGAFYRTVQEQLDKTAWAGSCNSWYKTKAGKIVNNWSGHTVDYWLKTRRIKLKDYHIR